MPKGGFEAMDGKTTIQYLQNYIRAKDHHPELKKEYMLKLTEEVGELAKAIRKNQVRAEGAPIKETIDEELWDVLYYVIALANCCGVDLERAIKDKEDINNRKYNSGMMFEENR